MHADGRAIARITSADDPRVAEYRGLRERTFRRDGGIFVAEGYEVVTRLLTSRFSCRSVFVREDKVDRVHVPDSVPLFVAPLAAMSEIVGFPIHRGVLAVGEEGPLLDVNAILPPRERASTVVVLEGISDHANVGAIFRNAAALGGDSIILARDVADPLYRKSVRVSMGAVLALPFCRASGWPHETFERLRERGYTLFAFTPRSGATRSLAEVFPSSSEPRRLALVFGAEGSGLSDVALQAADERVCIPMVGGTDSLNVATAAAIALFSVQSS